MAPDESTGAAMVDTTVLPRPETGHKNTASEPEAKPAANKKRTLTTTNPTKAESRKLLKEVWLAKDMTEAQKLASRIIELYDGKGAYPLSAVKAVAAFPTGFDTAVDLLFDVIAKIVQRDGIDHKVFWDSVRRSQGQFARLFKNIDKTLWCMLHVHWNRLTGGFKAVGTETNALQLFERTTSTWNVLLDQVPHDHIDQQYLSPRRPRIFRLSRFWLLFAVARHNSNIKAIKVTGDILPQELVDVVALHILEDCPFLLFDVERCERITGQLLAANTFSQDALKDALDKAHGDAAADEEEDVATGLKDAVLGRAVRKAHYALEQLQKEQMAAQADQKAG